MVLVDTIFDRPVPDRGAADLRWTSISFDYQQVPRVEAKPIKFVLAEELDLVHRAEIKPSCRDISDSKKRIAV
ncbi:hypothetical protein GCM10010472_47710 [Pseudonocardia halophobica]|uniref:Uncharacterized protein n=1 Tax=Pseudonocardia halophobica TaxID=29401 RepID=A0A9W6NYB3_9PSEU|nr:hypothetical protein GCM10017577_47300 [Pseudonocardia halophobica]